RVQPQSCPHARQWLAFRRRATKWPIEPLEPEICARPEGSRCRLPPRTLADHIGTGHLTATEKAAGSRKHGYFVGIDEGDRLPTFLKARSKIRPLPPFLHVPPFDRTATPDTCQPRAVVTKHSIV